MESEIRLDHTGKLRFQWSRVDMAILNRLRFSWIVNTDQQYLLGAKYILTKNFSRFEKSDSDFDLGGRISITY